MSPFLVTLLHALLLLQGTALPINITRLTNHLTTLATHNDLPPPSVQRILYTPADVSSRGYLKSIFKQAGLDIHEDPLGNIFATWHPEKAAGILTGSHFDAIPNSGMYDGTLGILSALEAITSLKKSGFVPNRSITILAFTSEEPTRFGLSCLGSRVLSGVLPPQNLSDLSDIHGTPFHAARATAGYTDDVNKVPLEKGAYSAFIELHSEQGPLLENSHTDIGAVTSIAAPAALSVKFTGPGGHAGTTLMQERKDPSLAAAELSLVVESAAKKFGTNDTVATTGYTSIAPNAVNSVPTEANLGIDVRDIDEGRRDRVLEVIETAAHVIAKKRAVGVEVVVNSRDPPASCDDQVIQAVVRVAEEHGMKVRKMVSRAYHDALFMARVVPTGMIFVPCRGGISHRPDEFVAPRDMENGVRVLAGVLKQLAGGMESGETEPTVNEMGLVEESGEVAEEILDRERGQDADVEDSAGNAVEEEEQERAESPEPAKAASKRLEKGKQEIGEHDSGEMTTPNVTCTCNASNNVKTSEIGKEVKSGNEETATSAKPKITSSGEPESTKLREPTTRESDEKEDIYPDDQKTTESYSVSDQASKKEGRESGNGRGVRSTESKNRNSRKPDDPENGKSTVAEPGEKATLQTRGRKGAEFSASQKNHVMDEKDEV